MSNLLGHCKEPGCEFALFVTADDQIREAATLNDITEVGRPYRMADNGNVLVRCPQRHKVFYLRPIEGTYSEAHQCDSRCLNAKGNHCTCSCGGANHGRGYAVTYQTVESVRKSAQTPYEAPEGKFLGEVGKNIRGTASVAYKRELEANGSVLYKFLTQAGDSITWFVPKRYDPGYEVSDTVTFKAKVKRHDDQERFGKTTIVTYLEEVAP